MSKLHAFGTFRSLDMSVSGHHKSGVTPLQTIGYCSHKKRTRPKKSLGLYEGADDTSFRGAFLSDCGDVLSSELLSDAWNHKLPDEAVAYGRSLLTAADTAEAEGRRAARRRGILSFLGLAKVREPIPIAEQLEIVRAAGRWFIFWGERGHAIRAWF